jgi:hypothetical protein
MKTDARFPVDRKNPSGRRLFGSRDKKDISLLIRGDEVVNGAWLVKWLTKSKTIGVWAGDKRRERKFYYICHVDKSVEGDYNHIINLAREVLL